MAEQMTLERVRDIMSDYIYPSTDYVNGLSPKMLQQWIDAIDAHLNAAKGEAVAWMVTRERDPTFPRTFTKKEKAIACVESVTLPPFAKIVDLFNYPASPDVVRDAKSGLQPINTAPEKTVVVAAWVDEDGCTRYEFDFKEDGVWFEHNERYEHYLSCAPRDITCTGPSEEAPYTHWLELPVIGTAMAAREGGE